MNKNYFLALFGMLSGMMLFLSNAQAQLTTLYPASNHIVVTNQAYTDLGTNGSVITTLNTDDALSAATPIGFTFTYNGASYTDFILSTNGFIKLGTVAPSTASLFYPNATSSLAGTGSAFNSTNALDTALVLPFNHDLIGSPGAEYRVHTTGTVGSRVCTIQFKNLAEKNTAVAIQFDSINFQVKFYEGSNVIDFVYGNFSTTNNNSSFRSAAVGLKGSSNAANQIVSVTKGSVTAWNLAAFLNGNYTGNAFNYRNNIGLAPGPIPVPGVTYRFIPVYANDIGIRQVYTLGKMPKDYTSPHFVRAAIRNSGTSAQSNFYVQLRVTGANPFIDSVLISGMNPNVDTIITFAGHSPSNIGFDTVNVLVNPDDNLFNNISTAIRDVNEVVYSYADPSVISAGGVGFTGNTGDFVAKFPYSGVANAINQVGVNFNVGGVSLRVGIWARNLSGTGIPGTLLWQSPVFVSTAGLNTIPVIPAVSISDTFFVGVIQTVTSNASFSFQNEIPIRNQTFYYTSPSGSTVWTDFSATGSNFRFMIEPRLQSPNDVGATSVVSPCRSLILGQSSPIPQIKVFNYGTLPQTNVPVRFALFNSLNQQIYIDSAVTGSITSGTEALITFNNPLPVLQPGSYTIKVWTRLTGDASLSNDTSLSTYNVVSIPTINNAGVFVQFDGADDHILVNNAATLNQGSGLTLEAWVNPVNFFTKRTIFSKDSSGINTSYRLIIDTLGRVTFRINTSGVIAEVISSSTLSVNTWSHVAATFDGSELKVYINGTLSGSFVHFGTINMNTVDLFIGKNGPDSLHRWLGGMDEIRLWNVARTDFQIRRTMHTRIPSLSDSTLMMYLRLDDGANQVIFADASGNCNAGTAIGIDVSNATVTPGLFISTIPLGLPIVDTLTVSSTGTSLMNNAKLELQRFNYTGSENYVVHYFDTVYSTLPTVNPGGVSTAVPHTWIIYSYGAATYDSIYARYLLGPGYLLGTVVESDVNLYRRGNGNGGGWNVFQAGANAVSRTPQSAIFRFTSPLSFNAQFNIAGNNNPLPVSMGALKALYSNGSVNLSWDVYAEINNKGFIVERSVNGVDFEEIAFVEGRVNAQTHMNYKMVDENVFDIKKASVLYYRVRDLDVDGSQGDNSNIARVQRFSSAIGNISVSPNPFGKEFSIHVNAIQSGAVKIELVDINGRVLITSNEMVNEGMNEMKLPNQEMLARGIYMLKISINNETNVLKIVKGE
jgi:hypothetical protein